MRSDLSVRLLSPEELLSAALSLTVDNAKKLLGEAGATWNILKRTDLQMKYGVTNGVLTAFASTLELASRSRTELDQRAVINPKTGSRDLADMMARLNGIIHEESWVAYIDGEGRMLDLEMLSRGDENMAPVSPGIIARKCILSGATAVVLIHNHPSGDVTPSGLDSLSALLGGQGDIQAFSALYEVLRALRIKLWDCIIVGQGTYWSARETGVLDKWIKHSEEAIEAKHKKNRAEHVDPKQQAGNLADLLRTMGG